MSKKVQQRLRNWINFQRKETSKPNPIWYPTDPDGAAEEARALLAGLTVEGLRAQEAKQQARLNAELAADIAATPSVPNSAAPSSSSGTGSSSSLSTSSDGGTTTTSDSSVSDGSSTSSGGTSGGGTTSGGGSGTKKKSGGISGEQPIKNVQSRRRRLILEDTARANRLAAVSQAVWDTDKQPMYSDDGGLTWTAATRPATNDLMQRGCYCADLDIVVWMGHNGECWVSEDGGASYTDYSSRTPDATSDWNDVAYSPTLGLFVAVGQSGTNRTMYTTDPRSVDWTLSASADDAEGWIAIQWVPYLSKFIAGVSFDPERTMHSTNGTSWTLGDTLSNGAGTTIIWSDVSETIAFTSSSTLFICYGTNGENWTESAGVFNTGQQGSAVNTDGTLWLTSGPSDSHYSTDRITWNLNAGGVGADLQALAWDTDNEWFVGLSNGVTDAAAYSTDAQTFTSIVSGMPTGASAANWKDLVVAKVPAA